jgi:hypothetical protein
MKQMNEKYCILYGDIHKLVKIEKNEDWSQHPWRFHEKDDLYWVPVKDWKARYTEGEWYWRPFFDSQCQACLRRWRSREG